MLRFFKYVMASAAAVVLALVALVQLSPATATHLALAAERSRSGLERREILLDGHLRYVYLEGGSGEPLLLLHGFGADKDNFTRVARYLTPHYRVIIPDHAGFGESSRFPNSRYSPDAQAERLHAFANALGVTKVHLGGSSMGGHIAMSYALAYPEDVASLWLLDPGGVWSGPKSELDQLIAETGVNPLMARTGDEFARVFEFVMSDPPYVPRAMLDVMARERAANFALEQKIFEQVRDDKLESRLKRTKIEAPALIVWGREDRAIHHGTADLLRGYLPNSRLIILDGIGHLPMIEAPERSAQDYLEFRKSL